MKLQIDLWNKIKEYIDDHHYMSGVNRDNQRVKKTGEVFTPSDLVIELVQEILTTDPEALAKGKTVLDPACGDGQFLVAIKWVKVLNYGMTEDEALADIYGVDIMRDNVGLCKTRLGGGTILMGDTLNPDRKLDNQTDEEYHKMIELFSDKNTLDSFFT